MDRRCERRVFADGLLVQCTRASCWYCPSGYRCDVCARQEIDDILEGANLLSMFAEARGIPRENLVRRYVKIGWSVEEVVN